MNSPVEVKDKLLKALSQEGSISLSLRSSHFVHSQHSPGMDRWVDIIKCKLVGGNLSVGSHVPLTKEQEKLTHGKLWVHFGKWNHVECKVPGGVLREKERESDFDMKGQDMKRDIRLQIGGIELNLEI